jgi:TniQ
MHVCKPMPDELARGHLVRLQLLNTLQNQKEVAQALGLPRERLAPQYRIPLIDALAGIASLDVHSYAQAHTYLPYWLFYKGRSAAIHGNKWSVQTRSLNGLATPHRKGSFCPQCVVGDVRIMGWSYWRRSHQIPGASWCMNHDAPLVAASEQQLYSQLPHHFAHGSVAPDPWSTLTEATRKLIRQYQALAEAILSRGAAIDARFAASRVRDLIRDALPHMTPGQRSTTLQFMAEQMFPRPWLDTVFKQDIRTGKACQRNWFHGITSEDPDVYPTVESCMIVLTMHFDEVSTCLMHLTMPGDMLRPAWIRLDQPNAIKRPRPSHDAQQTAEVLDA